MMTLAKKILLLAAFCGPAWGQTGFTTIQDTLYKADGTRFTGTLTIQWSTFDSTNIGTIVQQSKAVAVVNGNLQVQLAPNATAMPPANIYTVLYQSDGRNQFAETWTVPVSSVPLTVALVRTGTLSASGGSSGSGSGSGSGTGGETSGSTPVLESTVVGLVADLAQRPLKGVGFGTNAVAVVDDNGQIETAVGDPGNCVFIDGTTGPCTQPTFSDAETPGGIVDGTNNTLTLSNTPLGQSLMLFRNGLYQSPSIDFNVNGSMIVFSTAAIPQPGDTLTASYRIDTSAGSNIVGATAPGANIHTGAAQVLCSSSGTSTSAATWTSLGGCDIPVAGLLAGDRIEVRFSFAHSGTTSGFQFQVKWGNTTFLSRTGGAQDAAVVGRADAAITTTGAELSVESWGTVLSFLPGIVEAPAQAGLEVVFQALLQQSGSSDAVSLTNYTVLRYPGS
ncbi:MAG TPA: hypothetical protein VHY84_28515 [Bryobacteraceae bacterium]|jgi:hypothetical protein|nr:hypothetical protein [Bryobacteraceae bacterium]